MFVLPLGISFVTILLAASAPYRNQKITGAIFSLLILILDGLFYFTKNAFISYNTDGGLLLAFSSLFFFGFVLSIRCDDRPAKVASIIFSALMMTAFIGIAYWERPTLLVASDLTPGQIAAQNLKYQEYIQSFQNGEGGKWKPAPKNAKTAKAPDESNGAVNSAAKGRLDRYVDETGKVIERMQEILAAIDNFEPIAPSISDAEREQRGSQALAINNNATALNRKTLGLFHPHESSEAHTELIQATENLRLAAYSLYTYSLQEDTEEQMNQYKQSRSQIAQAKIHLDRFKNNIQNLVSNYQPQQKQEE